MSYGVHFRHVKGFYTGSSTGFDQISSTGSFGLTLSMRDSTRRSMILQFLPEHVQKQRERLFQREVGFKVFCHGPLARKPICFQGKEVVFLYLAASFSEYHRQVILESTASTHLQLAIEGNSPLPSSLRHLRGMHGLVYCKFFTLSICMHLPLDLTVYSLTIFLGDILMDVLSRESEGHCKGIPFIEFLLHCQGQHANFIVLRSPTWTSGDKVRIEKVLINGSCRFFLLSNYDAKEFFIFRDAQHGSVGTGGLFFPHEDHSSA
jgi:hypothetical protein